ncbi:MAG: hypothetical protein ACHQ53_11325 [Polyangiales bacterium]
MPAVPVAAGTEPVPAAPPVPAWPAVVGAVVPPVPETLGAEPCIVLGMLEGVVLEGFFEHAPQITAMQSTSDGAFDERCDFTTDLMA